MKTGPASEARGLILARREAERQRLVGLATELADQLDPALGTRAVVVFGSVARGDFNLWSDVDVLVVADHLPDGPLERLEALGSVPGVQALAWTPKELAERLARGDPIAVEASTLGIAVRGEALRFAAAGEPPGARRGHRG